MKNMRLAVAMVALAAAAALPGVASADDKGMYLGGSYGFVQYKDSCKRLLIPCDDQDSGWRAFAGYQFNRNIAAELGYADLGEVTGSSDNFFGAPASYKREVNGWDATLIGLWPLGNRLSVLFRGGVYRMRTTEDQEGFFGTIHGAGTNSGFTYGAGLNLQLGLLGIRAEWQAYENVGVHSTAEDDIHMFSLGLLVRF